jgi:hypothetical protein
LVNFYDILKYIRNARRVEIMDKEKYFSDYDIYTENEISDISSQGISLKNGNYIDFRECEAVWAKINSFENSKCIGERDICSYSFTFYSMPKPIMIKFIKKSKPAEFFAKEDTRRRFHNLQYKIIDYGYKTFDMS